MDYRTIEIRMQQMVGGAEMITYKGIMKYTGRSRGWVKVHIADSGIKSFGTGSGQVFHIHDIAKMLGE